MTTTRTLPVLLAAAAAIAMSPARAPAEQERFLLIDRQLRTQPIRVVEIDERRVEFLDEGGLLQPRAIEECIALARPAGIAPPAFDGVLHLADGQRMPGSLASSAAPSDQMLAWLHPWLGRMDVPLDRISAVTFIADHPVPAPGWADVVSLVNGDRLEGFVTSLGDPVFMEAKLDSGQHLLRIPLERIGAVALVTPRRPPTGRRVWFRDGTVLDVTELSVADDGFVRLRGEWADPIAAGVPVRLPDVTAILFDPAAMIPLGSLAPTRVETTAPRYVVPPPLVRDRERALGLGDIEYRGPIVVRYALPAGAKGFAAEAILPARARAWGDLEIVLRDDDDEVFRRRLSGREPEAQINVPLRGSELTVELTRGAYGPIQDRVLLRRAMVLLGAR